jgi:hypothetical protein
MFDWMLHALVSRDNIVGGTLNNMADIERSRRRSTQNDTDAMLRLKEREVKALEKIAEDK